MPLDHTRFQRARPADPSQPEVTVTDSASASRQRVKVLNVTGRTVDLKEGRSLEMHARPGMGQLTSDLTLHSLLEEVLEELRTISAYLKRDSRRDDR